MYSGGPGSFRGKLYADLVHHVTGVSLYDRWIEPETVREMAEAFDACDPEQVVREVSPYDHTEDEVWRCAEFKSRRSPDESRVPQAPHTQEDAPAPARDA